MYGNKLKVQKVFKVYKQVIDEHPTLLKNEKKYNFRAVLYLPLRNSISKREKADQEDRKLIVKEKGYNTVDCS